MAISKSVCAAALTGLFSLALAACENKAPLGPGFGDSVRHNMAVQIVNPVPPTMVQGPTDMSGPRAGLAIERYETGKVIDTRREQTTGSQQGSGAGTGSAQK